MKRRIIAFTLAISVCAASSALAQADLGLKNIGVAIGYVSPENLDGTFSIGGFINHGTIAPRFGLESRVDYWGWSESFNGTETSVRDIVIGARTKYHFEVANPKVQPYVGAGLGIHFINIEVNMPAQGGFPAMTVDASENKLGLDIGGGVAMPVSPRADFLGEAWYGIVSDMSQFSLRAGMQWKWGK
jgi:opacity protein-like surface antigen